MEAVPAGESNAAGEAQASEGEEQPQVSRVVAEADSAVEVQSQADGEGGKEAGAAFVADGVGCAHALSAYVGGGSAWPPLLTMHSWTIGHFALRPSPRALAQTRHLGHARRTRADIAHVRVSTRIRVRLHGSEQRAGSSADRHVSATAAISRNGHGARDDASGR